MRRIGGSPREERPAVARRWRAGCRAPPRRRGPPASGSAVRRPGREGVPARGRSTSENASGPGALASGLEHRVVGPRERDPVDRHQAEGAPGHVDALEEAERREQAGAPRARERLDQRAASAGRTGRGSGSRAGCRPPRRRARMAAPAGEQREGPAPGGLDQRLELVVEGRLGLRPATVGQRARRSRGAPAPRSRRGCRRRARRSAAVGAEPLGDPDRHGRGGEHPGHRVPDASRRGSARRRSGRPGGSGRGPPSTQATSSSPSEASRPSWARSRPATSRARVTRWARSPEAPSPPAFAEDASRCSSASSRSMRSPSSATTAPSSPPPPARSRSPARSARACSRRSAASISCVHHAVGRRAGAPAPGRAAEGGTGRRGEGTDAARRRSSIRGSR